MEDGQDIRMVNTVTVTELTGPVAKPKAEVSTIFSLLVVSIYVV